MDFLYGVALMVVGLLILDGALGGANPRILRHRFLDETLALVVTCLIGFGTLFLLLGFAQHRDALHATELGLSLAVILMSIRRVRRALLRPFHRRRPQAAVPD